MPRQGAGFGFWVGLHTLCPSEPWLRVLLLEHEHWSWGFTAGRQADTFLDRRSGLGHFLAFKSWLNLSYVLNPKADEFLWLF